MHTLTERDIRASLINVSQRERASLLLPALDELAWDRLDYLGWRDRKQPMVGCVVTFLDDEPTGIVLRQSEGRIRARPQCSWCEDVTLPNDVVMFSARRAGKAGRNGDTVGTLVCAEFQCSANVRRPAPPAYIGFDQVAERERRILALRGHVDNFLRDIRDSA
ncbi:FBP domain-containing protein [Cnuibacter sp. UC19_7]|uniref:FBP domain-containing protein n=1 Tax=Cnuibacter sp. UC19_7 TaxID=3350166 RepID=UPI00366DBE24